MVDRKCALESVGVDQKFWRGKRVLITGHTGFKGSWLSIWLQHLGARITGFALKPSSQPSLFDLARVGDRMQSVIGDIRKKMLLHDIMQEVRPEIVIHMAAQPLVRTSYENPVETFETNVMGTVNLLEAVRHSVGVRSVIVVTTDKCYENNEWIWPYRETEPMGGYDPYSSSKGCAELVTAAFRRSYFDSGSGKYSAAVASARAGNVIGGGDWAPNRLVPDIVCAFAEDRPALIRNPRSIRPWQHVLEPLYGYMLLAESLYKGGRNYAEAWNFGPNNEDSKSVEWVASELARLWGGSANWTAEKGEHPHEATWLRLDISKARAYLHWKPILSLEKALEMTVDWYQAYHDGADVRDVMSEQIVTYMKNVREQGVAP